MSEWKEYRLGDVCEVFGRIGFRGYTTKDLVETQEEGAISLSPSNIIQGELELSKCTFIKWDKYEESPEIKIQKGDIIFVKTGSSYGRSALVRSVEHPMTLNPQLVVLKNIIVNPIFLSYVIKGREFQGGVNGIIGGSAIPTLSQKRLAGLLVKLPSRKIQDKISEILLSIDSKIENNRKICANLEAQAQALFKHWFIDFAPFKDGKFVESELGMIPEGWRVGRLTEIADYMNGLAMQKFPPLSEEDAIPVLKIKELGQSQIDNNSDKCSKHIKPEYIIKDGDVIFSWSGTLLVDIWCGGICGLNQHLFKVTSKEYPKWFYLLWTKYHLAEFIRIAKDKAVTMGHIKREDLEKALVAIPDKYTFDKISGMNDDILNQIINIRLESSRLSTLRDTLLPKLMSGEIKV